MAKTISTALRNHLAQNVTTLATCWRIVRIDGQIFAFTTLDADLLIDGVTYQSTVGFSRTAIITHTGSQVDNLEAVGFFSDGGITEQDLKNGLFDYASVYLFAVNWANLSMGILRLRRGWLGECVRSPAGMFQAELRGITQALVQEFGNVYQPLCRADLGDAQCKVPIIGTALQRFATVIATGTPHQFTSSPLLYPANELNSNASISFVENITQGTAVEISDGITTATATYLFDTLGIPDAINELYAVITGSSLAMTATIVGGGRIDLVNHSGKQAVINKSGDLANGMLIQNFQPNYLDGGVISWVSGQNAGVAMELKTYIPEGQQVVLWLSMKFPIAIGDNFSYYPGCDKTRTTCLIKFNNILNFRGEPDMPGVDRMMSFPEAR